MRKTATTKHTPFASNLAYLAVMTDYTRAELQAAIGPKFRLVAIPKTQNASIHCNWLNGDKLAVIDFAQGIIDANLTVIWSEEDLAMMPDRTPDAKVIASARQELEEEVIYDWELAGFTVSANGTLEQQPILDNPNQKQPVYMVSLTKSVPTLKDAAETLSEMLKYQCKVTMSM